MAIEQQRRIGRPPLCGGCGTCKRCEWAAYMRQWNASRTPEQRKAIRSKSAVDTRRGRHDGHEERKRANNAVAHAVKSGRLTKSPCERCGAVTVHAHHEDYGAPLDIVWLCPEHHAMRHRERALAAGLQEIVILRRIG